jgi:DNA invertase Pin-like site-specific DNA recombinase
MKVVALFRVSTERQADEGASLDAQQRAYRAMAAERGWQTVAEFRGCESATQAATERRVLQQVLGCLREQPVDAVWVYEQSRLTRGDELEVASLMRELKERHTKIVVNGVVRDLGSIDERFMVGIQSLVDRAESERIKERMQRGKREKARQGKRSCGAAPFGYQNPLPGMPGRGTLKIVPDEATVVCRIFTLSSSGRGDRAVAVALNDAGIPAARGGKWCKTAVRRVLDNPAYIGIAASGIWRAAPGTRRFHRNLQSDSAILIENAHDPIVDRAAWDAVHGRAKLPRTPVPRMLSGLLFVNGEHFHGDSSRGRAYYRAARGKAGSPWLHVDATDRAVWDAFCSLATSAEFVQKLMTEAANPREQAVVAQEIEYLEDQIGRHQRRLDNLVSMRSDGEIDKATFLAKTDEAEKAIERLGSEWADLRSKQVVLDGTVAERIVKAVQVILPGCEKLSSDQKRSILRSIVRRVDVTVEETGLGQRRGERGRLAGSGGPRWAVKGVAFRLALPPQEPATGERGADEANGAVVGESSAAGHRVGQLPTTFSCSAPPGPAKA